MRRMNKIIGLAGVLGGVVMTPAAVWCLVSLGAGTATLAAFIVAGMMSSLIGAQTVMTGFFGSDDDQF